MDRRQTLKAMAALGMAAGAAGCRGSQKRVADSYSLQQLQTNGMSVRAAVEGTDLVEYRCSSSRPRLGGRWA